MNDVLTQPYSVPAADRYAIVAEGAMFYANTTQCHGKHLRRL